MSEDNAAEVHRLLANVAKLTSTSDAKQHGGVGFNVFRLCGVDHYENAHSRIIAEFLNPRGTHEMGDAFLTLFLRQPAIAKHLSRQGFPEDDGFHGWETLESAMVVTEEAFPEGRCDIAIHWRGWCIVIENKIYATDQTMQLRRYSNAVRRTGEKPIILYLTLDGHPAGADSAGDVEYKCISYQTEVADWIADCIGAIDEWNFGSETQDYSQVRETLCQYQQLVKELSGTSEEQKMGSEIVNEMVATPTSFKAACKVSASVQAARAEIADKIMDSLRKEVKSRPVFSGWIFQDQLSSLLMENGRYTGFWLEREAADKPYDIYCEFQARGALRDMFCGLTRREEKRNDAVAFLHAAEKSEKLKTKYTFYAEDQPGWLYGCYPHDKGMRTWSDDLLARLIDPGQRHQFAVALANLLQTLLEEADMVK